MEFDTFGGSKLELLCGSFGVDEFVKQVGLETTDTDGEEVIDKAKGWYGESPCSGRGACPPPSTPSQWCQPVSWRSVEQGHHLA